MPTFKEISTFIYNGNPSGSERIQISSSQSTSLQDVADLSLLTKTNTQQSGTSSQNRLALTRSYMLGIFKGYSSSSSSNLDVYMGRYYRISGTVPSTLNIRFFSSFTNGGQEDFYLQPGMIWLPVNFIPNIKFVKGSSVGQGNSMVACPQVNWNVVPSGATHAVMTFQVLPANYPYIFINVGYYTQQAL